MKKAVEIMLLLTLMLFAVAFHTAAEEQSYESFLEESAETTWHDKISEETWEMLDTMSDDELLRVWCILESIEVPVAEKFKEITGFDLDELSIEGSDEQERLFARFLSDKEEELGLAPGSLDRESAEGRAAISEARDFVGETIRKIDKEAHTNYNQQFADEHLDPSRSFPFFSRFTTNFAVVASKAEIISMANDDRCVNISYYEPGVEVPATSEEKNEELNETGDVNADGTVNSLDAALVLKSDANIIELDFDASMNADVNGDGTVNSLDAAQILKFDAKLITEF